MNVVTLPTLGVNEEEAEVRWEVEHRALVRRGATIAIAETTKTTMELQAEADGHLYQLVRSGAIVRFGEPVALLHERADLTDEQARALVQPSKPAPSGGGKRFTQKAKLLAEAKGIAIESVPAQGDTVKEGDVLAYLASQAASRAPVARAVAPAPPAPKSDRAQRVLVIGGGRGAIQVLDAMARLPHLTPVGVLDDDPRLGGTRVWEVPVLGKVDAARQLFTQGAFDAAVCSVSTSRAFRRKVFEEVRGAGVPFANVIDPSTQVNGGVQLGQGNVILARCHLGAEAVLGDNNFLSSYVSLEHHNQLGSHCTFGPAVFTSSRVRIGDEVKFGTGIFIEPGVTVGDRSIIGSGAVLVGHVPPNSLVKTKANYAIHELPK